MLIVELTRHIHGLAPEGSLVVADTCRRAESGEWAVIRHEGGAHCVRWNAALPPAFAVIAVIQPPQRRSRP